MTRSLKVALVVAKDGDYERAMLRRWVQQGMVDLVAFPEAFRTTSVHSNRLAQIADAVVKVASALAVELDIAVLTGVSVFIQGYGRMECAGYANPHAKKGETQGHFYAKHSTSPVLCYELPDYLDERDRMFTPVNLQGRKIGIQICHDQFFGLVPNRWREAGVDVLFDLTGFSVVPTKWRNVASARSLELAIPYLGTMSMGTKELAGNTTNRAFAFAYRNGREILPEKESKRVGALMLVDTEGELKLLDATQAESDQRYSELRIVLAPSSAKGDVRLAAQDQSASAGWEPISIRGKKVGLLRLPASALHDPLCIHRFEKGKPYFDVHIVGFTSSSEDLLRDEAMVLARLRAIEHRVAVVVCTPKVSIVLKSNRYKMIQCFAEHAGVYGLNLDFTGGTYESTGRTKNQGIPPEHHTLYRSLLDGHVDVEEGTRQEGRRSMRSAKKGRRGPRAPSRKRIPPRNDVAQTSWVRMGIDMVASLFRGGKKTR